MPRIRTMPALLAMLALEATSAGRIARAEDCLAGPNAPSPPGSHWYYRLDRATHRKCWYLGAQRAHTHSAVAERRSAAPATSDVPAPEDVPAPAPPLAPAAEAAPQPEPVAPPPPVAAAAPLSERIGPRSVQTTTERVRAPEVAKPPETAKPEAAAPALAASGGRGGLPAALFGIALLLAAAGTMLVFAGRRRVTAHGRAARRRVDWGPAHPPGTTSRGSGRARRSLQQILAQAEGDEPHSIEALEAQFLQRIRRGVGESTAFAAAEEASAPVADIATATLQPAIAALPPEAPGSKSPGVEPAPDVEQSLRRLLAAWERRAA